MYLVDYHTHPHAHSEEEVSVNHLKKFVYRAEEAGLKEIGFSDHDRLLEWINWDDLFAIRQQSELDIRLGLEVDYRSSREDLIRDMLESLPLDYVIGSVHTVNGWEVDHPDYIEEYERWDIEELYREYFNHIKKAVRSGLFDIIGHLDLIKVFDIKPEKEKIMEMVTPLLAEIKRQELVVEINTNGLNKPVVEIYPAREILEQIFDLEIPVTLGSDAHSPDRVGENLYEVVTELKNKGLKGLATFKKRKLKVVSI